MGKHLCVSNPAKVGIFSAISLAIFILGFYFLKGVDLFERKNSYYAVYHRVDGLYKSNLVEIDGFPVGRVGDMQRDHETGLIVVRLDLDNKLQIPNSDSTVAQLFSTDLFGTKKIRLVFGISDTYLKEGDTINTYFKQDLTEQIGGQIEPMMDNIKLIIPRLDSTVRGIKLLFDERNPNSVHTTIKEANNAISKVDDILVANEANIQLTIKNLQSIIANIEKSNAQITRIISNAGSITDSIQQANLKQTIANLNQTIAELQVVIRDINEGKGTLGKVIKEDELYYHVDSTIASLNALAKDIKDRPYRYISINVLGSKKAEQRREQKYNESGR